MRLWLIVIMLFITSTLFAEDYTFLKHQKEYKNYTTCVFPPGFMARKTSEREKLDNYLTEVLKEDDKSKENK